MYNPLITVLMTVYNGEDFLEEAIESILNQSYVDFEFLIIDDASFDSSKKIIMSYKDKRIKFIQNNKNLGQTASLNYGLNISKGKYIARMDQDDLSDKERLAIQYDFMEKYPDISILGSWAESINENGEYNYTIVHPTEPYSIQEAITCGCPLSHSSVFFDRKKILKINGYPLELQYAMDWGLWIKCIKNNYKIANISKSLVSIRTHSNNASSLKKLDLIKFSEQYKLFDYSNSISVSRSTRKYANGLKNYLGFKLLYIYISKGLFTDANKIIQKLTQENLFDIFPMLIKKIHKLNNLTEKEFIKIEPISKKILTNYKIFNSIR